MGLSQVCCACRLLIIIIIICLVVDTALHSMVSRSILMEYFLNGKIKAQLKYIEMIGVDHRMIIISFMMKKSDVMAGNCRQTQKM